MIGSETFISQILMAQLVFLEKDLSRDMEGEGIIKQGGYEAVFPTEGLAGAESLWWEGRGSAQTLKEGRCVQIQDALARGSQVRLYQEGKNGLWHQ